jgi:CO/xanthine dehydrogenase Mo-binding subunit
LPRKEDARLITGQSRYTDNLTLPGLLHMAARDTHGPTGNQS